MKVLMVCLGNICRSPLAEGIARSLSDQRGLGWFVDSAGTSGWHNGEPPDPRSIEIAAQNGIDISSQTSRKLAVSDFDQFDLILAMDRQNQADIRQLAPAAQQGKVQLMLDYSQTRKGQEVPDPYYGGPDGFADVFEMLREACEQLIEDMTASDPS